MLTVSNRVQTDCGAPTGRAMERAEDVSSRSGGGAAGRRRSGEGRALVTLARWSFVEAAPGLTILYAELGRDVNRRGLALDDVRALRDVADGAAGSVVDGSIKTVADQSVDVPRLRPVPVAGSGERAGGWQAEPAQTRLSAGESQKFRTRLATPPDPARKVQVSFALARMKG